MLCKGWWTMVAFIRNAWDILARILAAIGALMAGGSLPLLGLMMAADYGTGILLGLLGKSKQAADGRLSFRLCLTGIARKGMMLLIIFLAAVLDEIAGQGKLLRSAATGFYICNEGISLLENAAMLGVPVPQKLKNALRALREPEREENVDGNLWKDQPLKEGGNA